MQKLQVKLKNVPRNTSLVPCSTNSSLNRVQRLSVKNKVLACNNPEVNLVRHTGRQNLRVSAYVYVLSQRGLPLMPMSFKKSKQLVKQGKAKLIKSYPFTIQLLYTTGETKQKVICGLDPGYKNIGFSCIISSKELISGTVILENGMSQRLQERAMYRRERRSKLWYRESRFNNRGKEDWLAPSVKRRIDAHVNLVNRLQRLLPISQVNVEIANFDIQKIENSAIEGKGYQQGNLYNYENTKAFILAREEAKCQLCGKEYDGNGWSLHHIILRSKGGTDRLDNLALLHNKCHDKLHKQKLFNKLKKPRQYKAETFMSTTKWKILEGIRNICNNAKITFGYETKVKRVEQKLEKSHTNDAFVIAEGFTQSRSLEYKLEQKKRNNRVLQTNRKGYKPSIRKQRYFIQPKDLFWIAGVRYMSRGMFSYGKYILYGISKKKEYFKIEKVEKYFNINSWQFIHSLKEGVFLPKEV